MEKAIELAFNHGEPSIKVTVYVQRQNVWIFIFVFG